MNVKCDCKRIREIFFLVDLQIITFHGMGTSVINLRCYILLTFEQLFYWIVGICEKWVNAIMAEEIRSHSLHQNVEGKSMSALYMHI